jgi:hypothetical protein
MKGRLPYLPFLLCVAVTTAFAQDERSVVSPDGHVEFRVFVAPQEENALVRIAYQISYFQTAVIETSFLAIDVWSQEPMLGEATGLIGSKNEKYEKYNSLTANFMQNGSLGRLLNVEARAYNDGVAIRWSIPNSTPLRELLIAEEAMEFALPMHVDPPATLPLIAQELGTGWIEITEVPVPHFPVMHLVPFQDNILLTRLAKPKVEHDIAYTGATPLTGPWRVVIVGPTRESLARSTIVADLSK